MDNKNRRDVGWEDGSVVRTGGSNPRALNPEGSSVMPASPVSSWKEESERAARGVGYPSGSVSLCWWVPGLVLCLLAWWVDDLRFFFCQCLLVGSLLVSLLACLLASVLACLVGG